MADQSQWIGQPRVVRVFVSSTFRDMHEEREELVKRIFPQLRKLCEQRGVTWGEVDLRWGITREQAERGEVLPVCLEEIHRCRPYFIGLLGERYGWVPEEIPPELIEREGWLAEHRNQSVTELEILHGVLNNPEMANHAFFYFRDPSFADTLPQAEWENFREMGTQEEISVRLSGRPAPLDRAFRQTQPTQSAYPHQRFPGPGKFQGRSGARPACAQRSDRAD